MVTTGDKMSPRRRADDDSADLIRQLYCEARNVCNAVLNSSYPGSRVYLQCEPVKVRVIRSMTKRMGRRSRPSRSHSIKATWFRRRYVRTASGDFGVTTRGELIRFAKGPIYDSSGYEVHSRCSGNHLKDQWFFVDPYVMKPAEVKSLTKELHALWHRKPLRYR